MRVCRADELRAVRTAPGSTGVRWIAGSQAQPEIGARVHGAANAVVPAVQKMLPIETLDDHGQQDQ